jgi:PKHD-type hydroxylase
MWTLSNRADLDLYGWNQVFNKQQCEKIIELGLQGGLETAKVVNSETPEDDKARNSNIYWAKPNEKWDWVYRSCTDAVNWMNDNIFHYELMYINDLQFTSYNASDEQYYKKHIDTLLTDSYPRKLSFSILLSDPNDFEGGDLLLHLGKTPTEGYREQGKATFFNSMLLHEVTPVTKGTRYSLVGWVSGPPFK